MKKLIAIIAVFISLSASSQVVASLTMTGEDWAWCIGRNLNTIRYDSASRSEFRKMRTQILATPLTNGWATNITVTNIPEWVVMAFYRSVKTGSAGEIAHRYSAITTAIQSKAQLTTQINDFNSKIYNTDPAENSDFERTRNAGKQEVFDTE